MKVANASDDGHCGEERDANNTASYRKPEADAATRASFLPDLSTTKHPVDASTSIPPIEFREWSGMAAIVTEAWSTVGFGDAAGVNGWAVLVGINEVAARISSNLGPAASFVRAAHVCADRVSASERKDGVHNGQTR
ncbi:hypothetical protein PR003_g21549 [Phytophthora rubi]|uniref:Uncharacterized protein n=1 Tax=Phytophthora rubi TaxID=129364 RepID=A0A6A4DDE3_9STRA|nr:hypothetical protein PR002_g21021 [Phytophthora rubi]KAE8994298.1 hypothetical protein PR001_g20441 [Phytophthora rubi]KAE9305246.1 hypothetical protein PR003_g21549 [Phytophthora rubi]